MPGSHKLFLECYNETRTQFPGSAPHVLKSLADRLYSSMTDKPNRGMSHNEIRSRYTELSTALQTIDQWFGLKPGERPANAEDT